MRLKLLLAGACLLPLSALEDDSGDRLPNHKRETHGGRGCGWRCVQRLGSDWMTHQGEVTCVAWTADGSRILSGGKDKVVRVWNSTTGRPVSHKRADGKRRPLELVQGGDVKGLSMNLAGNLVIVAGASAEAPLRLWEADSGKEIIWTKKEGRTSMDPLEIKLLQHDDYQHFGQKYPVPPVTSLSWSPDGHYIASGHTDGTINLWDPGYAEVVRRDGGISVLTGSRMGHKGSVHDLCWRGDGRAFCSGGADRTLRVWDAGPGKEMYKIESFKNWVTALAWSPDHERIATGDAGGALQVWKSSTGEPLARFEGHAGSILALDWSPDGKTLISGGEDASARSKSKDSAIRVWDADTGKEIRRIHAHTRAITCLAFSPDGRRFCSGSADKTLRIWDLKTGREDPLLETHHGTVHAVLWNAASSRLLSAGDDRTLRLWETESGKQIAVLEGHTSGVLCAALEPGGLRAASGGEDDTIRIWDLKEHRQLRCIEDQRCAITAVAWGPRGGLLASAGEDKIVYLWNADTGARIRRLAGCPKWIESIAWSPNGKRIAAGCKDGTLLVWDTDAGKEVLTLQAHKGAACALRWDLESRLLMTAGWDGTLKSWNVETGLEEECAKGAGALVLAPVLDQEGNPVERDPFSFEERITACTWSPDLKQALTGNGEAAVLWKAGYLLEVPKALDYFLGHHAPISACAWSPDGKAFATAGEDSRILVWTR